MASPQPNGKQPKSPPVPIMFQKHLINSGQAAGIGPEAMTLLTVVLMKQDDLRFSKPVEFWGPNLRDLCGFGSDRRLQRARERAVKAGLLGYKPGAKGKAAKYEIVFPDNLEISPPPPQVEGKEKGKERMLCGSSRETREQTANAQANRASNRKQNARANRKCSGDSHENSAGDVSEIQVVLKAAQITTATATAKAAVANGFTVDAVRQVVVFWRGRPDLGEGILVRRFQNPDAATLPAADGWPDPPAKVAAVKRDNFVAAMNALKAKPRGEIQEIAKWILNEVGDVKLYESIASNRFQLGDYEADRILKHQAAGQAA